MEVARLLISVSFLSMNLAQEFELHTSKDLVYTNFYPITTGSTIRFKVKAKNDAFISLVPKPSFSEPYIEITFGGWSDTKSQLRKNRQDPAANMAHTPGFLHGGNKSAGFWVRLEGAGVMVGQENQNVPFMTWVDPDPMKISHFTLSTGFGSEGDWKMKVDKNADLFCGPQNELVSVKEEKSKETKPKKYQIIDETKSWDAAKTFCAAQGKQLASVRNQEEQRKLEQVIEDRNSPLSGIWIAANDRGSFSHFTWQDGTNDPVTYTNWEGNSIPYRDPESRKNCVAVSYINLVVKGNAHWFLQKCSEEWNFACESFE